ncbi:MAG: photosystem reaction center subunit H [Okeania sp. SIO3I5]|uniref:PRC-barrel domain-containing protein n=1 Tax=Okeania sp. SIO3I5 TaxID=2607805 RepID=UPI0013B7B479|nr:PRC-barrel domain-containing protein [Okeania sp. SIO3I5]NEQ37174.1 photosystem reaction center subunit H [Okeania sp. SIO3I5]
MTSEKIRQRSELLGTQIITRDKGKRLGVVSQLWVDVDRREVVAIGLRDNILAVAGIPKFMFLKNIRELGDVILVDDEEVLEEDIDTEAYSSLINSEVLTENGDLLGRVRGFKIDTRDGKVLSLIIASIGIPQIPDQIISTYELSIDEIVSSGPNRLIVFEGSEEKLKQLTMGVLERLGLGEAPWQREEEGLYYPSTVKPENQLPPGQPVTREPIRTVAPSTQETWDEDWAEPEPIRRRVVEPEPVYNEYYEAEMAPPPRQLEREAVYDDYYEPEPVAPPSARQVRVEPANNDYYEEDNWGDSGAEYDYEEDKSQQKEYQVTREYEYDEEIEKDAWADDESPKPYQAPRVNIPQKTKVPEYEEEPGGY